jgi:hypothetical protein
MSSPQGQQHDGLIGMAFDSLSTMQATTPFHNLVKRGLVDQPIFSFYMPHGQQGELTIGTCCCAAVVCWKPIICLMRLVSLDAGNRSYQMCMSRSTEGQVA